MKKLLLILLCLPLLFSCGEYKNEDNDKVEVIDEDCIHTGTYISEQGDTMPWTTNYIKSECEICNK